MSRDISPLSGDTRHDFRSHPSRTPIEGCGLAEAACGHLVEQLRVQQTAEVSCASCICFGRVDETRSTPEVRGQRTSVKTDTAPPRPLDTVARFAAERAAIERAKRTAETDTR